METAQLLALVSALWNTSCEAVESKTRTDIVCEGDVRASISTKGDVRMSFPSCKKPGKVCKLTKVPPEALELVAARKKAGK